jgi:hypothetical protein
VRGRLRFNPLVVVAACYLAGAVAVTWHLWADPASRVAAGNVPDADAFAWYLRYEATAVAHGHIPALITTTLNAPQGVSVMWNNFMLLPGVLLTPVTLAFGPQVSLTLLTTLGFACSAAAMCYVLRRWGVSTGAAGLAGAVYGFSPALLHSAIGHYNLQFAVLPPLIADRVLRLAIPRDRRLLRDGVWLGVLCAAQLFITEELLAETTLAVLLMLAILPANAPGLATDRLPGLLGGLGMAGGTFLALAGYPLWVQFFGPLRVHGSRFPVDSYQNDVAGFVTPSRYQLLHTAGSAAAAARFPYGAPEYLAYLGWPLLAALIVLAVLCRRHVAVGTCAIVLVLLELLSLGAHGRIAGTGTVVSLPWAWLRHLPLLGMGLPDRLSIFADGFAAAMLGFGLDALMGRVSATGIRWRAVALWSAAVVAVLPLTPLPLPFATAPALPAGWQAAFAALRLPPGSSVLIVPVPGGWPTTAPMRWQADTGSPASLIGGYFQGPDRTGHAALDGGSLSPTALYLDRLWLGNPPKSAPAISQVEDDLRYWRPAAVVAVADPDSPVGRYLITLLGPPPVQAGHVIAWRLADRSVEVAAPDMGS